MESMEKPIKKKLIETTFAMFDIEKVQSVTIGVTIPLNQPYANIRLEVTGDDPETCRRCLIETLTMVLPFRSPAEKQAVTNYMNNVLVKTP